MIGGLFLIVLVGLVFFFAFADTSQCKQEQIRMSKFGRMKCFSRRTTWKPFEHLLWLKF